MNRTENWDWDIGDKIVSVQDWGKGYNWIEELKVSDDGEKIAAIVNIDLEEFSVLTSTGLWDSRFEKIWNLCFAPDGRLTAIVSSANEWTVAVDGEPWSSRFDYVWNLLFSPDGSSIAAAFQSEMAYGMVRNDVPWDKTYYNITEMTLSPDGENTAAAVQTVPCNEGEIEKFAQGIFSAAINGTAWDRNFVNVWKTAFHPGRESVAAEVRLGRSDYSIAVNGNPWKPHVSGRMGAAFQPGHRNGYRTGQNRRGLEFGGERGYHLG